MINQNLPPTDRSFLPQTVNHSSPNRPAVAAAPQFSAPPRPTAAPRPHFSAPPRPAAIPRPQFATPTTPAMPAMPATAPAAPLVSATAAPLSQHPAPLPALYGGMMSATPLTMELSPAGSELPFSAALPLSGVSFEAGALTVPKAATYQLSYELMFSPSFSAEITAQVLLNGEELPAATLNRYAGINRMVTMVHSTYALLPEQARLTMRLSASDEISAELLLAQLTLSKLG